MLNSLLHWSLKASSLYVSNLLKIKILKDWVFLGAPDYLSSFKSGDKNVKCMQKREVNKRLRKVSEMQI